VTGRDSVHSIAGRLQESKIPTNMGVNIVLVEYVVPETWTLDFTGFSRSTKASKPSSELFPFAPSASPNWPNLNSQWAVPF
jgi:hypothetical protein